MFDLLEDRLHVRKFGEVRAPVFGGDALVSRPVDDGGGYRSHRQHGFHLGVDVVLVDGRIGGGTRRAQGDRLAVHHPVEVVAGESSVGAVSGVHARDHHG